jgi:hypothetical protein
VAAAVERERVKSHQVSYAWWSIQSSGIMYLLVMHVGSGTSSAHAHFSPRLISFLQRGAVPAGRFVYVLLLAAV